MPPTGKKKTTSFIRATDIAINGEVPLTALPVAGGTTVLLDDFATASTVVLPKDAKWVLFASTVDFVVKWNGPLPTNLTGLATLGNPNPQDPDNAGGPGDSFVELTEVNPGLREVTGYQTCEIKGIGGDGLLTMLYYE